MNWDLFFDIIAWGFSLPISAIMIYDISTLGIRGNEEGLAQVFVFVLVCAAYIIASWGI